MQHGSCNLLSYEFSLVKIWVGFPYLHFQLYRWSYHKIYDISLPCSNPLFVMINAYTFGFLTLSIICVYYCGILYLVHFLQFSWSKPQNKHLCLGNLLCSVHFHLWLGFIFISYWKYAG